MAATAFFSSMLCQTISGHSCLRALRTLACTDLSIAKRGTGRKTDQAQKRQSDKLLFSTFSYGQYLLPFMDNICFLLWSKNISLSKNIILSNTTGWKTLVWVIHWGGGMITRDPCWKLLDLLEHPSCADMRELQPEVWSWAHHVTMSRHIYLSWRTTHGPRPLTQDNAGSKEWQNLFSLSSSFSFLVLPFLW